MSRKICIIGTGKVAHFLAEEVHHSAHELVAIAGRNADALAQLALVYQVPTPPAAKLPFDADLYIIAVADGAIGAVAVQMPAVQGLVVHTAGAVPLAVLGHHPRQGSLYPLQSINAELPPYEVPYLLSAHTDKGKRLLEEVVPSFPTYKQHQWATDAQRLQAHLAAVFANNFGNALVDMAQKLMQEHGMDEGLLSPLISQTAAYALALGPAQAQTGPALRGDNATLERHLALLHSQPALQTLYTGFSDYIRTRLRG